MAKINMEQRYSPEEVLRRLDFLQMAVDNVRRCLVGMMQDHKTEVQKKAAGSPDANESVIVMAVNPTGYFEVLPLQDIREAADDENAYCEQDMVYDDQILMYCNPEEVVTLGGTRYLLGTAIILEADENGNECSINDATVENVFDFIEANLTSIMAGGKAIPAFRLDD